MSRAIRDYTAAQFRARLKKHGFRSVLGLWFEHDELTTDDGARVSLGALLSVKTCRVDRRATLAHLLAERRRCAIRKARKVGAA